MKKTFTLTFALLLGLFAWAQDGVNFRELTFADALTQAKAENKLLFVDCYTSWCGPCKHMTNNVFPQKEAGDYFNARFVCVKYDMEKGEGVDLKTQYQVRAYPTFLLIRPDGSVQHRVVGGGELDSFIERIERGLHEKTTLSYLDERYASGKMGKEELVIYCQALDDAYERDKAKQIKHELKAKLTDKDKVKARYWDIVGDRSCRPGTPDFDFILTHIPALEKNVGKEKIDQFLFNAYYVLLNDHARGRANENTASIARIRKDLETLSITRKAELLGLCELAETVNDKNAARLLELFETKELNRENIWIYGGALSKLDDQFTKADFTRIAKVWERVTASTADEATRPYFQNMQEQYQKRAHIGVLFEDLTFEQALAKAKKNHSMIFMDCYTSWCGPCKYMTNTIFPQEKMGDYLNRFICVKYDMEKGEGPELLKRFNVGAFPTFIILNPDGTVRHKIVGGNDADGFIEQVKEAFDDTKATGLLDAKYREGNRDKEFLNTYLQSLLKLYSKEAATVAAELFAALSEEERVSEAYWKLFSDSRVAPENSENYKYLLANRPRFNETIGKANVDQVIYNIYSSKFPPIIDGRDSTTTPADVETLKKEIAALWLTNGKALIANANIAKAALSRNQNQLLSACEKELAQMTGEQFPYYIVYHLPKDKLTPALLNRWNKLLDKVVAKCTSKEYAEQLKSLKTYLNR